MNIFKHRSDKRKSGLRLNDLSPKVKKSLLNSNYTVYVDFGINHTLFGFLRKSGRGQCVYILDKQQRREHPQRFQLFAGCED